METQESTAVREGATNSGTSWSKVLGVLAAVVSIGAGIYLLTSESVSVETTVFDALMHGIGAYFVARGLWMLARIGR